MLRLRTTAGLSALALLAGIAGTGWLSNLTARWREPSDRVAMVEPTHAMRRTPPRTQRLHRPVAVVSPRRAGRHDAGSPSGVRAAVPAIPVTLQPLFTPADTSQSWDEMRGHLDGQLLVRLRVDGAGRVDSASVVTSSGDPVLDEHAMRSVRAWRFAVPADDPAGLSGELPMRFASRGRKADTP
jgi:protein TonB